MAVGPLPAEEPDIDAGVDVEHDHDVEPVDWIDDDEADEEITDLQGPEWPRPYRDGRVHVMADKCSSCVFRPGNLMHLPPGRLKGMADDVQESGIPFSCHQTLSYAEEKYNDHYGGNALCAGAVEAFGAESTVMRMAHAYGVIADVEPYPEPPKERWDRGPNTPEDAPEGDGAA